jgi:general secretion pathway protein I
VSVSKPHRSTGHPSCGPHGSASAGSAGFTLLEALIAIVILALSLSALLSVYSTGLRGIAAIDSNLRARLLAQSVMAEVSYDRALRPGKLQGRSDEFAWALSITPFEEAEPTPRQAGPWAVHQLVLTVSWPHGRRIELQTLRMLRTQ